MATIQLNEPHRGKPPGIPFFAAGFRPFFLFAAIQALLVIVVWVAIYSGAPILESGYPALIWHGHEMVFGFAVAAVAGFLLTAVPNWTGCQPLSGPPLALLFLVWLGGRLAFTFNAVLPAFVPVVVELAFLPLLAAFLAGPLIRAGKARNIAFLGVLAALWLADGAVFLGIAGYLPPLGGIHAGIFLALLMIVVVGGRIIPGFTRTWLMTQGQVGEPRSVGWIERWGAVTSIALSGIMVVVFPETLATGIVLLVTAAIQAVRLSGWNGMKTLSNPLLWVLHLGYLWLVVGLFLYGISQFITWVSSSAALHALTAGSIATMVIGVMSRAALGHAGRPLKVGKPIVVAYALVSAAALLRVVSPLFPAVLLALTGSSGLIWSVAWAIFTIVYLPIVTMPRADGKPG